MSKDKIYSIIGIILIIISILMLVLIPDISGIEAIASGFCLGIGFGLLISGENVFAFLEINFKMKTQYNSLTYLTIFS